MLGFAADGDALSGDGSEQRGVLVDEAHCLFDWGFDFRPDYQRLAKRRWAAPP